MSEKERSCTKCGRTKKLGEFHKKKNGKYGRTSICRSCIKLYRSKNRAKLSVWHKADYLVNKEKILASAKKYRENNEEKIKSYRNSRKKEIAARNKDWRKRNSDTLSASKRTYSKRNKVKIATWNKAWREKNREKISTAVRLKRKEPSNSLTLLEKIPISDEPRIGRNGYITVVCRQCGLRTTPTNGAIQDRVKTYNKVLGENNFYCSEYCKGECLLHGFNPFTMIDPRSDLYVHNYDPRELQRPWAKEVKERDSYKCQGCDNPDDLVLHAHHIEALATTYDAWLVENGITLCGFCHENAHSSEGCRLQDIRAESCL